MKPKRGLAKWHTRREEGTTSPGWNVPFYRGCCCPHNAVDIDTYLIIRKYTLMKQSLIKLLFFIIRYNVIYTD